MSEEKNVLFTEKQASVAYSLMQNGGEALDVLDSIPGVSIGKRAKGRFKRLKEAQDNYFKVLGLYKKGCPSQVGGAFMRAMPEKGEKIQGDMIEAVEKEYQKARKALNEFINVGELERNIEIKTEGGQE